MDLKFVVIEGSTGEWFWHAYPVKGGKLVGWSGETHQRKAYVIRRAKIMAHGRPVYLKDSKTKKLTLL
jgi:hypothetical protein